MVTGRKPLMSEVSIDLFKRELCQMISNADLDLLTKLWANKFPSRFTLSNADQKEHVQGVYLTMGGAFGAVCLL